ncbi:MAG: FtsX-like permease family protein [Prevotella sp.]|nr:FtsX-like permease family protein [Prevotella sp.]MDY4217876.1 FtsX-like permease family protein [Prevotella sp.]
MHFPFYIARRYLFSKKSTNAINIISFISVVGVAVATMAMVVVLSGFNGFSDLVASFFTNFDPQLKVEPAKGKSFPADDPTLLKIKALPEVAVATECVTDQALASYNGRQTMVTIKGMQANFDSLTHISNILYGNTDIRLKVANLDYAIVGVGVANKLGMPVDWQNYLHIYAPVREGQYDPSNPLTAFVADSLLSANAVFQVKQGKYDNQYIITSIDFARRIFSRQGEITSLELRLKPGEDIEKTKEKIKEMVGVNLKVSDRYEQQADTFKIMRIEKLFAYAFLTFILLIASFNIIGSLSMLMIDKKDDAMTLRNLGASEKQISQIFLFEGRMISVLGAIIGIALGLLLCWLQQTYGLVRLGNQAGVFVINAYPISVHLSDIFGIFATVILIGWISVWYPVRHVSRRISLK